MLRSSLIAAALLAASAAAAQIDRARTQNRQRMFDVHFETAAFARRFSRKFFVFEFEFIRARRDSEFVFELVAPFEQFRHEFAVEIIKCTNAAFSNFRCGFNAFAD